MSLRGTVADIQHCSVHDGPGLRTTVFLKGCPLNCAWCHNPECISFKSEILKYPEKCIGCGRCDEGCYSGARILCGTEMTIDEVMQQIIIDKPYYGDNGGVTISGGEPFGQLKFTSALVDECNHEKINCALETSLFAKWENIKPVIEKCQLIMSDLKIWKEESHIQYTGVSNKLIKENFVNMDKLNLPFVMRTVIVCGVNDNELEISKIAEFAATLKNLKYYELLPYHPLGLTKSAAVDKIMQRFEIPDNDTMNKLAKSASAYGINSRIAGREVIS